MKQLTDLVTWKLLKSHAEKICPHRMRDLQKTSFSKYPLTLKQKGIQVDFRYQQMNEHTLDLLINLAHEKNIREKIASLMSGSNVNTSEEQPALHTALRVMDDREILVNGRNIVEDVFDTREKMRDIAEKIRSLNWYGYSGKPVTAIVNIGIGGSDLGPRFCVDALNIYTAEYLSYHFISDADPNAFRNTVKHLNQETTLFIVSSKSFTTQETLLNARKAIDWFGRQDISAHFIAVTVNVNLAKSLGIHYVLPIWNWVGGRFSFCSAINLISCIALGFEQFMDILNGAYHIDHHFQSALMEENIPVMLALVGIWNINFLHITNMLVLVYARQLEKFVPYLQQLDMESNGKSIDIVGRAVNYATGPIVWGGLGNQAQHSYFQLLCQGSHPMMADFISSSEFNQDLINDVCYAKMQVLSEGVHAAGRGYIPGGMRLNHIKLEQCSPFNIGMLIALYEHKIYVQGAIWNINVFDQPGVERAKCALFSKTPIHIDE